MLGKFEQILAGVTLEIVLVRDVEGLAEILNEVLLVFDADCETHQFVGDADLQTLLARQFEMRHATWQFGKRFHRTERNRQTEDMQVVEHVRRVDARHHFEAQYGTTALETVGGQLVFVTGQSRIMHGLDQRVQQQIAGNRTRVLLLTVHAQGKRLDAATHRIAFVRREHATQTVLCEVDALAQLVVLDHHEAGVDFGMAGQILGGGMDDDVGALVERLLQIRVTNVLSTMAIVP